MRLFRRLVPRRQAATCKGCGRLLSERRRRPCPSCGETRRIVAVAFEAAGMAARDRMA
jgi:RNA polymerase subunit RPABC4/transcription elongation factor Spt4